MSPTPLQRVREALESHGSKIVSRGSDTFQAQCPAHADRDPSLSVRWGAGSVIMYCHAGCETKDVVSVLGLSMADLYPEKEVRYAYTDAAGKVLRTVHRSPEKKFRQSGNTKDTPTLYRLPEVLEAVQAGTPVYFVEGEKDADNLALAGAVATTFPGGASNVGNGDLTPLTGAMVKIVPDQDAPGEKWARTLLKSLHPIAQRVTLWRVPTGKDFTDSYAAGHGPEDLEEFFPEWLEEAVPSRRIVLTPLSAVKMERVSWLWQDRIPRGEITVLGGREGEGKSTLAAMLAAKATRGDLDGDLQEPGRVLWVTAEDSPSHVLKPRLQAAGADMDLVNLVSAETLTGGEDLLEFPRDIPRLAEAVRLSGAVLLVVDPISSVLQAGLDTHKDRDMRQAFDPLKAMAEETGAAVLALHHVNKAPGTDFRNLLLGARAFSAVPRSVLGVLPDSEDPSKKVLTLSKSNLVNRLAVPGLAFTVETKTVQGEGEHFSTGAVRWLGEDSRSTEDLMRALGEDGDEHKENSEWLREFLLHRNGSAPRAEVLKAGRKEGLSESAIKRAFKRLNGKAERVPGFQAGTEWFLPEFYLPAFTSPETPQEGPPAESGSVVEFPVQEVLEATARRCKVKGCREPEDVTTTLGGRAFGVCKTHATENLGITGRGEYLDVIA